LCRFLIHGRPQFFLYDLLIYVFMQHTAFTIGIDIGGTNTNWGIVNREGEILHTGHLPTSTAKNPTAFFEALHHQMESALRQYNHSDIQGIGIGAPQTNFHTGLMMNAANMPWKGFVPIREIAETVFHLPVQVTNDANAAAMGEMIYGAAKGMRDFIVVTLGTGLGSGIVSNGQLLYGHHGMAGELGHTIVMKDGRTCGCGRKGCLETYVSATGIVRTALELLEKESEADDTALKPESLRNMYRGNKNIQAHQIYEAAQSGDPLALRVFRNTGDILGLALANAVAVTEPEAIILFGGLAKAGALLFEPTAEALEANLLDCYRNQVKLLPSGLREREASILGSAALGWRA